MENIQIGNTIEVKENAGLEDFKGLTGKVTTIYAANGTEVNTAPFSKETNVHIDFSNGHSQFFNCENLVLTAQETTEPTATMEATVTIEYNDGSLEEREHFGGNLREVFEAFLEQNKENTFEVDDKITFHLIRA